MQKTQPQPHKTPKPSGGAGPSTWERIRPYLPLVISVLLILFSLYVRYVTRAMTNSDMDVKILTWYAKLQRHGPLVGLGKDFYNYTPPYVYLLALATLTSSFVAPLTSVKIIATIFDIFTGFMIFKIVRLQRPKGFLPVLAAAAFFAGPTFLVNSAVWGQADSAYTLFFLICLYCLLVDRPWVAIAAFSIALAFKPQGIFFAPLLLLMMLWGRLRWYHFLAVPVVYAICMAPAVALGRTWYEVFTAYTSQAGAGKALTHNGATLYVFIPKSAFDWLLWPAVVGAILIFLAWVFHAWRTITRRDVPTIVLLTLVCVTLVPFFLPNMRERYYYPADTLSLILAFMLPGLWYLPILFQILSMLSYSMFLWAAPQENLQAAALISLFTLILLLRRQALLGQPEEAAASQPPRTRTSAKGEAASP
jgi:Gpi18-like mannosyltransferase